MGEERRKTAQKAPNHAPDETGAPLSQTGAFLPRPGILLSNQLPLLK